MQKWPDDAVAALKVFVDSELEQHGAAQDEARRDAPKRSKTSLKSCNCNDISAKPTFLARKDGGSEANATSYSHMRSFSRSGCVCLALGLVPGTRTLSLRQLSFLIHSHFRRRGHADPLTPSLTFSLILKQ